MYKTKLRFLHQEAIVVYESGNLLVAAFDVIEASFGKIKTLRDVSAKLLVADLELGFELNIEVVSTRRCKK